MKVTGCDGKRYEQSMAHTSCLSVVPYGSAASLRPVRVRKPIVRPEWQNLCLTTYADAKIKLESKVYPLVARGSERRMSRRASMLRGLEVS